MAPHIEELLKSALLGTDKYVPNYTLFGEALVQKINETGADREDTFLRQCAAAFAHEAAGATTTPIAEGSLAFAGATGPLATGALAQWLETALREEDRHVGAYLAFKAHQKQVLAPPHLVPDVLDWAARHGDPKGHFTAMAGPVGQWLSQFHERWQPLFADHPETEDFETATHATRLAQLRQHRQTAPEAARELLERVIHQEAAEARSELLQTLREGLGEGDIPFLEKMLKDKSKKVRERAIELLCLLPASELAQKNLSYLGEALEVEEKRMLLLSKKQIKFSESAAPDPLLLQLGLEKVSAQKGIDDHIHQIAQVLAQTHPDHVAARLGTAAPTLIELLYQSKWGGHFGPYLALAAERFAHPGWSRYLLEKGHRNVALLHNVAEAEHWAIGEEWMQKSAASTFLHYLLDKPGYPLLPHHFASKIIDHLKETPYHLESEYYSPLGFLMPDSVVPKIEQTLKTIENVEDRPQQHLLTHLGQLLRSIHIRQQVQD